MTSRSSDSETRTDPPARKSLRILETGLLVTGSALLGGLAVALWHRKSLSKLRERGEVPAAEPIEEDAEQE